MSDQTLSDMVFICDLFDLMEEIDNQAKEYIENLEETNEILEKEVERFKRQIIFERIVFGAFFLLLLLFGKSFESFEPKLNNHK